MLYSNTDTKLLRLTGNKKALSTFYLENFTRRGRSANMSADLPVLMNRREVDPCVSCRRRDYELVNENHVSYR
jgi:hypothetical protein